MIDKAYQSGVNYFDTAYPYHGGKSECVTGRALDRYPRDSYYLATKLPIWEIKTIEDVDRIFHEQLNRLGKDYVDFYLMHALNKGSWETIKKLDILAYCEKLGIPLVIMEPIKGGSLANLPEDITKMFREVCPDNSTSSWALRYVGSFDNVKVILSGMSDMSQVEDNLKTFGEFKKLSDEEQKVVENVANALKARVQNGCTGCRYCMPCPFGVDIPKNFHIWNQYHIYENVGHAKWEWSSQISDEQKAKNCKKCGKCESACPQKISIRDDLERLQADLDSI